MNTPKSGLWTNKMKNTPLPREYNRKYKLSESEREEIIKLANEGCSKSWLARKFNVVRSTIYLIIDEEYRKRTYKNTKHNYTREYMREKKYESQKYKKEILDKLEKGFVRWPIGKQNIM